MAAGGMMAGLSGAELARRLRGPGLAFQTGPFAMRVRSEAPPIAAGLALLYPEAPLLADDTFCDFEVDIASARGLRRWLRPQAFPLLEWAMNWCISTHVNHYLLIHSAVIERGGKAVILPAPPGSGKSTLCAALVNRGWRLLSDEIAVIPFDGSGLRALARPVSLKNQSIQIIADFAPEAVFSPPVHNTAKGTVAHMRAPGAHARRVAETAQAAWVVFPSWQAGAAARLSARDKPQTLLDLAKNSFNYGVLGKLGFETLSDLVQGCECHDFVYSRLDDAIATFDALAGAA